MSEHATLAPSSAPQWAYCSGSVPAQASVPQFDTPATMEGTAAHWVGETVLQAFSDPTLHAPLTCAAYLGKVAPNGVVVTDKMVEGAQIYVDHVLNVCQEHGGLSSLKVEYRVHMPHIHPDNWGTLDAALVMPEKRVVHLWDYKHGHSKVRAKDNWQLADYLEGLMSERSAADHINLELADIHLHVVQPFSYDSDGPVDTWTVRLSDMAPYRDQLKRQAHAAMTAPKLRAGDHCRYCTAIAGCTAAKSLAYRLLDYVDSPFAIDSMSGADLAVERSMLATGLVVAKARQEAIEDTILHMVTQGDTSTGLAAQSTPGRQKWDIPVAQAIALANQFGVDAAKPDVLTPTQTVKAAPAEMRPAIKAVLDGVTSRPAGKLKLVPADGTTAARAFSKR